MVKETRDGVQGVCLFCFSSIIVFEDFKCVCVRCKRYACNTGWVTTRGYCVTVAECDTRCPLITPAMTFNALRLQSVLGYEYLLLSIYI